MAWLETVDLQSINIYSLTVRLVMATLCGGLIGLERGRKLHAAGFRTHMLVCIGATMAMLTNQYVIETFNTGGDPTRIGAQVISGIGFLGAGTIIVTGKQRIVGLTTAAGLWASAIMGLAIGIGFYEGALMGCVFIFFIMTSLQSVDRMFTKTSTTTVMYIEVKEIKDCKEVIKFLKKNVSKIYSIEINKNEDSAQDSIAILCHVKLKEKKKDTTIYKEMKKMEGVEYIEDIA